jgi:hypothetical protein
VTQPPRTPSLARLVRRAAACRGAAACFDYNCTVTVDKQTKSMLLLSLWLAAVSAFFVGAIWLSSHPRFIFVSAFLFGTLGVACLVIIALPAPREYPPGFCQACGYDLTGNVSGRCSECGVIAWRVPEDLPPHAEATRDA